jgi:hypothetical protein
MSSTSYSSSEHPPVRLQVNRPETYFLRHYIAKGGRIARISVDKRSSGRWPVSKGIVKDVRRARTIKQKSRSPSRGSGDSNELTILGGYLALDPKGT